MNIFLIGYRCTGKTSVGKILAKNLGWDFEDTDSEVVKAAGMSISEIVSQQGWDEFREKERSAVERICKLDARVVGTGGGVVLNPESIKDMKQSGVVVWLRAAPEIIRTRILQDKKTEDSRPALTSEGSVEEIEKVLSERTPLYENAMDFYADTDCSDVNTVCRDVISELQTFINHYEDRSKMI
ncbi:shikimate kinase [Desulfococcaceae bacterium HSG8]|nr:shikimate kinase [Desulfococcaceae bacterium HSG8]